jgi:hypothetical protein
VTDKIKDSGKRKEFGTGAVRDVSDEKGRFDLLPYAALRRVACHFGNGARKYEDRNWEKGMTLSTYVNSASRHMMAWVAGLRDEDHAAAWAWNALCAIETEARIRAGILPEELDDLPDDLSPEDTARWLGMIEEVFEPVREEEELQGSLGTIYVAGPMRGRELLNFPAFDEARDALLAKGWRVVSPADEDRKEGFDPAVDGEDGWKRLGWTEEDVLARDKLLLKTCSAMVLLPGWQKSRGVGVELLEARKLGLEIFEWDQERGLPRPLFTKGGS